MYLNSSINKIEDFERYSFLLELNDIELGKLDSIIKKFRVYEDDYFKLLDIYNDINKEFKYVLENNNVDDQIYFLEDLLNKEIIKNKNYLAYLTDLLYDNSIFIIDTFKNNLNNGKIIRKEYIEKLKNDKNKEIIDSIIEKINEMEHSSFNKRDISKKIIKMQKELINEIEVLLDKLYYILNIKNESKDIKSKYILITNVLKDKNKNYELVIQNLKDKVKLLQEIKTSNLPLDINDIKKISEDGIEFLLEKLRLYNMHKEDRRVNIDFMVRR